MELPKMLVGNTWFGQTRDTGITVPVVDRIGNLAENLSCSIFQRINASGDMLRIASNVIGEDGLRAIGTYIPRMTPEGKANPVISQALRGQSYQGRAFVVDKWYLTAYEPIFDQDKRIVGMLSVGIPQESVQSLRQAIYNVQVGETGYVYVLDSQGRYFIFPERHP